MVRGSGRPGISEIVAYAPGTDSLRVIGSANVITNSLAVSADGAHVAFLGANRTRRFVELRVLSTRAVGEARTVYRAPRGSLAAPVAFFPDGQRLLFEQRDAEGSSALWSVAIGGGAPARVLPRCCDENDVRIHPDGRRMTFAMGQMRGELWMLTGY
jgi:Tol biopolymer transport system component